MAGARKQKNGSITLPPDPFNIEQLLEYIPELSLGPDATVWYNNYLNHRKKLAKLKQLDKANVKDKDWLYNYQTVDVKFMSEGVRTIEASEMGTGKAGSLDSEILTPNGWVRMGDISIGDKVTTPYNGTSEVIGVFPQGESDMYEVTFSDGTTTKCTNEHLWPVNTPNRNFRGAPHKIKELKEIKHDLFNSQGYSKQFVPVTAPIGFKKQNLPIHPYLLGVILGDGTLSTKNHVGISNSNKEIIDKVKSCLPDNHSLISSGRDSIDYRIINHNGSNKIVKEIKKLSLDEVMSYEKFIPEIYLKASIEQRVNLLQGLMDTDGYINKSGSVIEYYSSSETLIQGVQYLIQSLGGVGRTKLRNEEPKYTYGGEERTGRPSWGVSAIKLPKTIKPFSFSNKLNRISPKAFKPRRSIQKVEYVGKEEAQCILIDSPNHLYITDNFIVTHNTNIGIAFAKEVDAEKVLVISPKSVIYNWQQEISKWDCNDVVIVDGTASQREKLLKEESKYKIINYAMLRKGKYPILFDTKWDVVLFDEAHRLKNRKTQQSKGAGRLKADYISMLTGSPIPNHPHELWHLLHILYPRRFKSYWRFVDRFCVTRDNFFSPTPDIVGVKNEELLKEILVPIMIRNKKEDVLKDLPPKTYKAIELDMLPEQQRIYNEMEEDMVTWIDGEPKKVANDLGKMIRLQQIALSPALIDGPDKSTKTTALLDLLEDTTGKVVVFSWFKGYIKLLEKTLKDKGYGVVTVHGEKSTKERGKAQDRFWKDDKVKVFLGTIGAAGEGVNLQCASTLVFMDKSWVPSDNRQAEDRIHRKGQKGNATIISFIARNSIDVDKELALADKERIINKVMSMEETAKNLLKRISK